VGQVAKLIFIGEKFGGRVYEFVVPTTSVGRGDHNTLTIHDDSVSSTHCEILVHGLEVIVRDLGSSNGTVVNGERIHRQQRELKSGQTVKFGSIEARLELEAPSPSDTATGITAAHAFSRYLREQKEGPKKPAAASMTLESGPASAPAEHTMLLSRPPPAEEKIPPPAPEKARSPGIFSRRATIIFIVAALALGLTILLWLIWGRN